MPGGAGRIRRAEAKVPEHVGFAAKSELAMDMLARALDAGVPAGWRPPVAIWASYAGAELACFSPGDGAAGLGWWCCPSGTHESRNSTHAVTERSFARSRGPCAAEAEQVVRRRAASRP